MERSQSGARLSLLCQCSVQPLHRLVGRLGLVTSGARRELLNSHTHRHVASGCTICESRFGKKRVRRHCSSHQVPFTAFARTRQVLVLRGASVPSFAALSLSLATAIRLPWCLHGVSHSQAGEEHQISKRSRWLSPDVGEAQDCVGMRYDDRLALRHAPEPPNSTGNYR